MGSVVECRLLEDFKVSSDDLRVVSEAAEAETYTREVHLALPCRQLLRSFDLNLLRVSGTGVTVKVLCLGLRMPRRLALLAKVS